MEVVAEKNVLDDECEVQEIQDESKVQDSLIDDWSKKVLSESETTERNKSIKEIISLIITQKVEQRKRKELNQFAVFELFIVYTYGGKYLKDFTIMLLKQSETFLEKQIDQLQKSAWFRDLDKLGRRNFTRKTKRFVYRFLYQMVYALFATLKDSISLSSTELEGKYPFLLEWHKKTQTFMVKEIALRTLFAEDIFYVGCTKLGSLNSDCSPGRLISAIIHTDVLKAFEEKRPKKAISAIQDNLGITLNKEMTQELYGMVEQFLDPNNRLRKFPMDIASIHLNHVSISDRIISTIKILKRQRVSKDQFKSVLENEISSNSNEDISVTLDKLISSTPEVFKFVHLPVSVLTSSNNLFCGFLNLVMHAIRLLYKTEYMCPRRKCHLSTLKLLRSLMGENFSYEESLTSLCIKSFSAVELSPGDLVRILCERQLSKKVSEVGLIDISPIASYPELQDSIGDLFTRPLINSDCGIFVIQFTGQTVGFKSPIPFSFYYDYDRKSKSLASFRWVPPDSNWVPSKEPEEIDHGTDLPSFDLQCLGGIYFSEALSSYKFAFLSYSPNYRNAKYSQFILDNSSRIHTVNSSLLSINLDVSHRLVSLILIKRKDGSSRSDDPLKAINNTFLEIQGLRHQWSALYARITDDVLARCADQNGWLTSDPLNALVIIINKYFGEFNDQSRNIFFDTFCYDLFESKKHRLDPFLEDMNKSTTVMHFPINIRFIHWVYSFISVEHETIFLMDSIAPSIDSIDSSVKTRMIKFADTNITGSSIVFKPVYLASPKQNDGVSCGVFTILNILKVSKAVHDGQFESFLADQSWGKKYFTVSEKVEIRSNFVDIIRGTKSVDVLFKYLI
jgi:hypothetical protein